MKQLPKYLSLALALLLVLMAFARSARADNATAEALFNDAKKLMDQGKFSEACPKLEESQRLDPGMGTQFHLAYCYEKVGKTASAWSLYLEVAGAAKAVGQVERERVSRSSAAALEKKLSRLTIVVPAPAEGIAVKRDNIDLSRVIWGTPIPVDPGEHTVTASAPNKKTWEHKVTLGENADTQTVEVPELADGKDEGAGAANPETDKTPDKHKGPIYRRRSKGMIAGGIVMMVLGAPTFVVGGVAWLGCGNSDAVCRGGAVVTIIGGLLTGGGIALTVTGAEKVKVEPPKASYVPEVFIGPRSAAMRWTF